MRRQLMRLAICVGLSGTYLFAPLAAVAGERATPQADVLTNPGVEKGQEYWTAERMRNAKPVRPAVLDPDTFEPIKPE